MADRDELVNRVIGLAKTVRCGSDTVKGITLPRLYAALDALDALDRAEPAVPTEPGVYYIADGRPAEVWLNDGRWLNGQRSLVASAAGGPGSEVPRSVDGWTWATDDGAVVPVPTLEEWLSLVAQQREAVERWNNWRNKAQEVAAERDAAIARGDDLDEEADVLRARVAVLEEERDVARGEQDRLAIGRSRAERERDAALARAEKAEAQLARIDTDGQPVPCPAFQRKETP